jgi:hypothetical protein
MYAQVINGNITQIADEQSLRQLYPSTHFPSPILESHLEGFDNWYVCEDEAEAPAFNPAQKKVTFERVLKDKKVKGSYVLIDLSNEEKAEVIANQWRIVKYHRDNTINSTDYLAMPDVFSSFSVSDQEKIITYRQALRDITDQTDPFNINWPTLGIASVKLKYTVEV